MSTLWNFRVDGRRYPLVEMISERVWAGRRAVARATYAWMRMLFALSPYLAIALVMRANCVCCAG
jgi:hypothetical protein